MFIPETAVVGRIMSGTRADSLSVGFVIIFVVIIFFEPVPDRHSFLVLLRIDGLNVAPLSGDASILDSAVDLRVEVIVTRSN